MDNIANIGRQRDKEISMARARRAQPAQEVMQIVVYRHGSDQSVVVRYTKRETAIKDFDKLLKAADSSTPISLSTPAMTAVFRDPSTIAIAYLIDVEANNVLMADTQRRMNAAMQLP